MRPDQQGIGSAVHKQISDLVDARNSEGVLLIVELLTYRLDDEDEDAYQERFPQLVVEAARLGASAGSKILKVAYPGSREASAEVTAAAAGTPWAVLSAGVDHDTFAGQVTEAVIGGASGAMAGRALWKDSLSTSAATRQSLRLPSGRSLGTRNKEIPRLPAGASGRRASTRWTIWPVKSWPPKVM